MRVIAPFIGGGFGPKIMMFYQEEVLVPWAAMKLGRPVKWIEDRAENFVATTHERGQVHEAEIALTKEGLILGVQDVFLHDTGAYAPYGLTVPLNSQCTLLGPYDIKNYHSEFTAVFTNKTIVTPYRGAGRQHGVFVIERLLDIAARELKIDRAEIRRRNFIQPHQFPYDNQIIYQDFAPLVYDSGNYEVLLDQALEKIGYRDFIRSEHRGLPGEEGAVPRGRGPPAGPTGWRRKASLTAEYERIGGIVSDLDALDVLVAEDRPSRDRIWEMRRCMSDALTPDSPVREREDVVVPRAAIPELFRRLQGLSERHGVEIISYGHIGDGNVHVNVMKQAMARRASGSGCCPPCWTGCSATWWRWAAPSRASTASATSRRSSCRWRWTRRRWR